MIQTSVWWQIPLKLRHDVFISCLLRVCVCFASSFLAPRAWKVALPFQQCPSSQTLQPVLPSTFMLFALIWALEPPAIVAKFHVKDTFYAAVDSCGHAAAGNLPADPLAVPAPCFVLCYWRAWRVLTSLCRRFTPVRICCLSLLPCNWAACIISAHLPKLSFLSYSVVPRDLISCSTPRSSFFQTFPASLPSLLRSIPR